MAVNSKIQRDTNPINAAQTFATVEAHTDRTRFANATRFLDFQKQIKPSTTEIWLDMCTK